MKENSKVMKEKPGKNPQGRKCSVCTHLELSKINRLVANGSSFRAISRHFFGNDSARDSVRRHTENCLKIDLQAFVELKKLEQKIDFGEMLINQFNRANKLTVALEKWLADPENIDEFDISPRGDELTVIYLDYKDTKANGEPKQKKAILQALISKVEGLPSVEAVSVVSQAADNRKLFLDSFKTLGDILEKYAKHFGEYAKDNEQKKPSLTPNQTAIAMVPIVFRSVEGLTPGMVLDAILKAVTGADEWAVEAEVIRYLNESSERTLIETNGSIM